MNEAWPSLPLEAWSDTRETFHLWTQMVGKVRLRQTPWTNHSWHVTLYVTPRGRTTSPIPYRTGSVSTDFDFCSDRLEVHTSAATVGGFPLEPMSVATFYRRLMEELTKLGLDVRIDPWPNEIADPIRFDRDETH